MAPHSGHLDGAPPATPAALARRFLRLIADEAGGRRIGGLLGLTAAATAAEGIGILMLIPLLSALGLGGGAAEPVGMAPLAGALGLYLLIVAAAAALLAGRSVAAATLRTRLLDGLRSRLHAAALAMSWPDFQSLRGSDLKEIMTVEVGRMGIVFESVMTLLVALMLVPTMLVVALVLSPGLTLLTLALAGLALVATRRLGRLSFALGRRQGEASRAMMADLADDLAGLRVIKAFGAERARAGLMERHFAALRAAQIDHVRMQALEKAALQVAAAVTVAVALLAAVTVMGLSLAEAAALILAFGRLSQTLLRALTHWRRMTASLPALEAYERALARCRAAAEPEPAEAAPEPVGEIRLEGVAVRFADGRAGLRGVDAVIPVGRVTALIGPTGAGKSTLADLVAGLASPTEGAVAIDGVPLSAGLRRAWRRRVGLVPQDPFLFHDTIRANLLLARPEADEAALRAALEEAAGLAFVDRLPRGLDTVVGDRGMALSGGERQRVALARALLRRPSLLVLDEATASLDQETEGLVAATLDRLRGRATVLVVAHRPATVRHADHVILLEEGRVAAAGDWPAVRRAAGARLAELGMLDPAQEGRPAAPVSPFPSG